MTIQGYFEQYPKNNNETVEAYLARILQLSNEHSPTYARKAYFEFNRSKKPNTPSFTSSDTPSIEFDFKEKPALTLEELIGQDLSKTKGDAKYNDLKRKYNYLLKKNEELELRFETALNITEPVEFTSIEPTHNGSNSKATSVIMLSDWHFEERVDGHTINNLNEYNLDIAKRRFYTCQQNAMKLVNNERQSCDINSLILWLGGDFITGYIHEELEEDNYLSPTEAVLFAKQQLIPAIEFYIKYGKFATIKIVCNSGNHGRTNKKPRVSTEYKNSYEWMMYHDLKNWFSRYPQVEFIIPNGLYAMVNVYGKVCRFFHGHHIKFGGGIGGLTIPLTKALLRADQAMKADYNFMGHYHQFSEPVQNCTLNGSGIGYGAYALMLGAKPEAPIQGYRTIHSKYGLTTKLPIFCE